MKGLLTYFFCLLLIAVHAQVLPIKTYTVKDGLSSNAVYGVLRDTRGILWVGTPSGINWYNGDKFTQPSMPAKGGQIYVNELYEDKHHNIWILTFYNGLYKYDVEENRFYNFFIDSTRLEDNSNNFFDILEIGDHHFLVATDYNAYFFDEHHFTLLDPSNKKLYNQISSAAQLPNGDILLGTTQGLYWYEKKAGDWKLKQELFQDININKVFVNNKSVWIATNKGLLYFDKWLPQPSAQPQKHLFAQSSVTYVGKDHNGNTWVTGDSGAYKINGDTIISYSTANGLPANFIHSVYRDNENNTWFGTEEGLARINDEYFRYYSFTGKTRQPPEVLSAAKKGNTLWFGYLGGIIKMDGEKKEFITSFNGKKAGYTFFITADRSGLLWAGTDKGLATITGDKVQIRTTNVATCMYEDENGTVWFGGQDGTIFYWQNNQFHEVKYYLPKRDNIKAVYKDTEGYLWVGLYSKGVRKFMIKNDSLVLDREYSYINDFSNLRVRCFVDDKKGNIIFGSRTNGIYIFPLHDTSIRSVININADKGLKATWVKAMALDDAGNILMATNTGLHILSGSDYHKPVIHTIPFSSQKVPLEMGAITKDGSDFWVGTFGLVKYSPSLQVKDTVAPKVYITQVTIQGRPDSAFQAYSSSRAPLDLSYEQNIISFDFVGTSLKDENAVRYRYMLEGQDKDWSTPTDRKYINYGRLPPGHYTFKVIAQNVDSVWSATPAAFPFVIAKPFWQSWWFITLMLLCVAGIIYSVYRYRLTRALELERLRMKISTDLHDDIGSTLSSISILSDMVIKETQPGQSGRMVKEIKDNSVMLMEKMDDIVWSINPGNDSLENLLLRVKRFAAQLFEAKGIDYDIRIQENIHQVRLPMGHRQHIYLIMKEAINNLVKYAASTKATITVAFHHHSLLVNIQDNGKGFDKAEKYTGNGILSMQNRAMLMGAKLDIQSAPGSGTTVALDVKIK